MDHLTGIQLYDPLVDHPFPMISDEFKSYYSQDLIFKNFTDGVDCVQYQKFYENECKALDSEDPLNQIQVNECYGCYIENYCEFID